MAFFLALATRVAVAIVTKDFAHDPMQNWGL